MVSQELISGAGGVMDKVIFYGGWGLIAIAVLGGLAAIGILAKKRKKWNMTVGINMARSDGLITNWEKGKGHYNATEGVVSIKRKGLKPYAMKPFDVRKYLKGKNHLEVLQIAPDDHIPIDPQSYTKVYDEDSGEEKAVVKLRTDLGDRRQWAFNAAKNAKNWFTLGKWLDQHWKAIEIGIIIFCMFIGFVALYSKIGS